MNSKEQDARQKTCGPGKDRDQYQGAAGITHTYRPSQRMSLRHEEVFPEPLLA